AERIERRLERRHCHVVRDVRHLVPEETQRPTEHGSAWGAIGLRLARSDNETGRQQRALTLQQRARGGFGATRNEEAPDAATAGIECQQLIDHRQRTLLLCWRGRLGGGRRRSEAGSRLRDRKNHSLRVLAFLAEHDEEAVPVEEREDAVSRPLAV